MYRVFKQITNNDNTITKTLIGVGLSRSQANILINSQEQADNIKYKLVKMKFPR
jgi:hypothetical protein